MKNFKFIIYLVDGIIRIKNMSDGFLFKMFNTYINCIIMQYVVIYEYRSLSNLDTMKNPD